MKKKLILIISITLIVLTVGTGILWSHFRNKGTDNAIVSETDASKQDTEISLIENGLLPDEENVPEKDAQKANISDESKNTTHSKETTKTEKADVKNAETESSEETEKTNSKSENLKTEEYIINNGSSQTKEPSKKQSTSEQPKKTEPKTAETTTAKAETAGVKEAKVNSPETETPETNEIKDSETEAETVETEAETVETEPTETEPAETEPSPSKRKEPKAVDFTVYDEKGNPVKLSDFYGKPIVLNFWASWCGPCKREMPDFNQKFIEQGDEIQFLMINLTGYDTLPDAKAVIEESGYTFPVFYDLRSEAAAAYSVQSFPTTYFIDADGYLIAKAVGAINAETLQSGIDMIN